MTGVVAAKVSPSLITLSDHQDVIIDLIRKNIETNHLKHASVTFLDWTNPEAAANVPGSNIKKGMVDVIIASDCVYGVDAVDPLVDTLSYFLQPEGRCVMSYKKRWLNVDGKLRDTLSLRGFALEEVPLRTFMRDENISEEVREDGFLFLISRKH